MLFWEPPDMPPEVLGYRVHVGKYSHEYSESIDVGLDTHFSLLELDDGEYFFGVTAYNGNGEGEFSNEASTIITSVQENETEVPKFSIYPNPFSKFITIRGQGEVTIFNVLGQLIKTIPEYRRTVNTEDFPSGIYLFVFRNKVVRGIKRE